MNYQQKYIKYKNKYLLLTKQKGGFDEDNTKEDYTDLIPFYLKFLDEQNKDYASIIERNNIMMNDIKKNPSNINQIMKYGFTDIISNQLSIKYIDMIPQKYKSKIIKLRDVTAIKQLVGCTSLKEVTFAEEFSYYHRRTIYPNMLPDSLEKIEFHEYGEIVIEEGALPKNLRELKCNPYTYIMGNIPSSVKLVNCDPSKMNIKAKPIMKNTDIITYENELRQGTLTPNITDLWIGFDNDKQELTQIPSSVIHLKLYGPFNQPLKPYIFTPQLKLITIINENYSYKDQIPKNIKVIYGDHAY